MVNNYFLFNFRAKCLLNWLAYKGILIGPFLQFRKKQFTPSCLDGRKGFLSNVGQYVTNWMRTTLRCRKLYVYYIPLSIIQYCKTCVCRKSTLFPLLHYCHSVWAYPTLVVSIVPLVYGVSAFGVGCCSHGCHCSLGVTVGWVSVTNPFPHSQQLMKEHIWLATLVNLKSMFPSHGGGLNSIQSIQCCD